jgi:hypothetical protein
MANEYTLLDWEMTADPVTRAVVKTWREVSPIMDLIKFKTADQLVMEGLRFNTLPTVPWRKIGESYTQLKVTPDPWRERLHFMGAKIDVPKEYVKAGGIVDLRAQQSEAIVKGAAFGFTESFFLNTGDETGDEDAIVGLWYRLKNDLGSDQRVDAALDVSPDTAVASWQHRFFDVVDDLLDRVEGDDNQKVLFMGRTMYKRLVSALRSANQLFSAEHLGRIHKTYGPSGPMIVQAGYKVDQSTQILGDAENGIAALTGSADSSMYCVRFGEPYLAGWCQTMPMAEDVGLLEDRVNLRTVVDFSPGLYAISPRYAAIAYNFTAA